MNSKAESYKTTKVRIIPPYPITHHFKAGREFKDYTISSMMHARFPYRSESEWKNLHQEGRLGVDGKEAETDYRLESQDQVFHFNPRVVEPAVPDQIRILQSESDYLIAYKPAPMPMHPGGRYNRNSLTKILDEEYGDLKIVHRLDAVTSGIVLFAKSKDFAAKITKEFEAGRVQKKYAALVSGTPSDDGAIIKSDIRRKAGFVFESGQNLDNAKPAETHFKVVQRFGTSAIVECNPITGRTHQIRLHLKEWGFPIYDDPIYGIHGDESSVLTQNVAVSLMNIFLGISNLGIEAEIPIPDDWYQPV